MSRYGANIYKRKDGRWEGRVLCKKSANGTGASYRYFYGRSYSEVKEKMLNTSNVHKESDPSGIIFQAAAEQWLARKRFQLKESSYSRYQNLLDRYLIPELGSYVISEIDNARINQYISELLSKGRKDSAGGLAPKTVTDIMALLKAIMKFVERQGCEVNIFLDDISVRRQRPDIRVLNADEADKLTKTVTEKRDPRGLGIMLSLFTGIRLGEACALRWRNVDLDAGTLHICSTMQRIRNNTGAGGKTVVVITEPKSTSSLRAIPLPDFMLPILRSYRSSPNSFVLTGREDRYVEPRALEYYFSCCIRDARIRPANYHLLRHTFATRCVELGFDIKTLSEILGHSNVGITLDRYVHSSLDLKKANMSKLQMYSSDPIAVK